MSETEVRADDVKLGDYLLGLGRVEGITRHRNQTTLHGGGGIWKVQVHGLHPVVVLRAGEAPTDSPAEKDGLSVPPQSDGEALARAVSASLAHGEQGPLADALSAYLSKHPWSDL